MISLLACERGGVDSGGGGRVYRLRCGRFTLFYRGVSAKFTACCAGVLAPAGLSVAVSRSFAALARRARVDGLPVWWRCVAVGQHLAGMLMRAALVESGAVGLGLFLCDSKCVIITLITHLDEARHDTPDTAHDAGTFSGRSH